VKPIILAHWEWSDHAAVGPKNHGSRTVVYDPTTNETWDRCQAGKAGVRYAEDGRLEPYCTKAYDRCTPYVGSHPEVLEKLAKVRKVTA
jgi:hypothetical protein